MKTKIKLVALLFFAVPALSQKDSTGIEVDTSGQTEIKINNVSIKIKDKPKKNKEAVYDKKYPLVNFEPSFHIGVAGYFIENSEINNGALATSDASLELNYGKCRNYVFNGNILVNFNKNIGLLTGMGFEINRYAFEDKLRITENDGDFVKDSTDYTYYQLKTNYLQIPLMLTLKSNNQKVKFAVGGIFSYNVRNKVKYEYYLKNAEYKTSIINNYNMAPFKISLGARFSYNDIGLYFNYGLTQMNDKSIKLTNKNSNLMPFSAGIILGGL